jgi:hypothetical protein
MAFRMPRNAGCKDNLSGQEGPRRDVAGQYENYTLELYFWSLAPVSNLVIYFDGKNGWLI